MSDEARKARLGGTGPCEAEQVWFEASDRFYAVLTRHGQQAALKAARETLERLPEAQPRAQGNTTQCKS